MAVARFQVLSLPRSVAALSAVTSAVSGRATPPEIDVVMPRRFTWRFLAANNRALAVASNSFADASSCVEAMYELRSRLATAKREIIRGEDGLWMWKVVLDTDVATSSHRFRRQVRARMTCDTFFALAADDASLEAVQVVYR